MNPSELNLKWEAPPSVQLTIRKLAAANLEETPGLIHTQPKSGFSNGQADERGDVPHKHSRRDTATAGAFATAVKTVVDYLWNDEQAAYYGLPTHTRRRHLFRSLLVLRRWLDEQKAAGKSRRSNLSAPTSVRNGSQHE